MKVEIWSDVVCPWCYVGKRRFETALAAFEHRADVAGVTGAASNSTLTRRPFARATRYRDSLTSTACPALRRSPRTRG